MEEQIAVGLAQLVAFLLIMHSPGAAWAEQHNLGRAPYACTRSSHETEAGRPDVPWLHNEFEASLGCVRP